KGTLLVIALAALLLITLSSMAFADTAGNEEELQVKEQQELQEREERREMKEERLQKGEYPCSPDCEPQQKRLQENKKLFEQREERKELKQERMEKRQGSNIAQPLFF
ncbi:MAG: hypothetical protein D5R97_10330, partial [Candidatus Syntrophonatronum acetioxidans]